MTTESKLAVLLHADVVGSSALVQEDERLAHEQIQDVFRRLSGIVEAYGGTTHEVRGDALVAEFPRASDAVSAAIAYQVHSSKLAPPKTSKALPLVRMGISMGEVVIADGTVTGLGVVLAQRIEQVTEPGGVGIQGAAYETIPRRFPFVYESLGEHMLKGIVEPVRVFLCELAPGANVPKPESRSSATESGRKVLALPSKPSVAVLPFDNMSGESDQDYFAEGISEDITTALSRFGSLFVTSRHSSFMYRGRTDDARTIATELGVQFILRGSVRKAGNRVRVTAQLIDTESGQQVWADRFDRDLEDIFDIQDEITSIVCSTLAGRVEKIGTERAKAKSNGLTAYDYLLRGLDLHKSGNITPETARRAVEMFSRAVEADPGLARGYAWLACSSSRLWPEGWNAEDFDDSLKIIQRALTLDPDESEAHRIAGSCYLGKRQFQKAEFHIVRALELNPNDAHIAVKAGDFFSYVGQPQRARELVNRAMRLNPHHPAWYWQSMGLALYVAHEYAEAISAFRKNSEPSLFDFAYMTACFVALGDMDSANKQVSEMLAISPALTVDYFRKTYPYTSFKDDEALERFLSELAQTDLSD
jgi:adenylate cyclase